MPADGYDQSAVLAIYDGMAEDYAVRFGTELRTPTPETPPGAPPASPPSGSSMIKLTLDPA
ncbi:MAG TPA: hypothetical protein VF843_00340 [Streptosporangiaceae bacterium]